MSAIATSRPVGIPPPPPESPIAHIALNKVYCHSGSPVLIPIFTLRFSRLESHSTAFKSHVVRPRRSNTKYVSAMLRSQKTSSPF